MLERLGFIFGELARLDELIDEGLVLGDQAETTIAEQVAPAVTDLSDEEHFVDEAGHRRGGAHAAARAVLLRSEENARARLLDGVHEAPRKGVAVFRGLIASEGLEQRIDRHVACHLARRGAAHAVAHRQRHAATRNDPGDLVLVLEGSGLVVEVGDHEVVLVVLAHEAHVGLSEDVVVEACRRRDERSSGRSAPALHPGLGGERLVGVLRARLTVTVVVCVAAHSAPECIRCPT